MKTWPIVFSKNCSNKSVYRNTRLPKEAWEFSNKCHNCVPKATKEEQKNPKLVEGNKL